MEAKYENNNRGQINRFVVRQDYYRCKRMIINQHVYHMIS